jgi:hypothetical protein
MSTGYVHSAESMLAELHAAVRQARREERERCARVCEEIAAEVYGPETRRYVVDLLNEAAWRIRKGGEG